VPPATLRGHERSSEATSRARACTRHLARTYGVGTLSGVAELRFEWNRRKNASNRRKHGVSFEEAETAFADDYALVLDDPDHSDDEDRFVLFGLSATLRVLVGCHCYRRSGDVIRIISARKADRGEEATYSERARP